MEDLLWLNYYTVTPLCYLSLNASPGLHKTGFKGTFPLWDGGIASLVGCDRRTSFVRD